MRKVFVTALALLAAAQAQPDFADEWTPAGYQMQADNGNVKGSAAKVVFDGETIMRSHFTFGSVKCSFGIEAAEDDEDHPYAFMHCNGQLPSGGALQGLTTARDKIGERVPQICGDDLRRCPPKFLYGMMDYVATAAEMGRPLPDWEKRVTIKRLGSERAPSNEHEDRKRSHTCSDSYLGSLVYPNNNEPNCPVWDSSHTEGGDGATCMCPWSGGGVKEAWYDTGRSPYQLDWLRYYGGSASQCSGRCGATCNSLDKEAFLDCFDHDACVDHVGGSSLRGNSNCGDEFDHAADDYVVSYGWGCC